MNKVIAITIGDIRGIGIKILIDSWKNQKIGKFILVTNIEIFKKYLIKEKIKISLNEIIIDEVIINYNPIKLNILSYDCSSVVENTYKSLKYAYKLCKTKICIGMITLPIRKDLIIENIDKNFIGHTEMFQKIDKQRYSNMILYNKKIIITPLTTHISLKKVSKKISSNLYVYNQIYNLNKILQKDFNIKKPKLLISGLNPHAGENGKIGNEEKKFIIPIVTKLKRIGVLINGPVSADSMLISKNFSKYNCFIYMYHDQALIPFKYISQFTGVNYTGNLSIIRASPDHGTAYNLIGSKEISDKSFLNCYKLIKKIYRNRMINEKS